MESYAKSKAGFCREKSSRFSKRGRGKGIPWSFIRGRQLTMNCKVCLTGRDFVQWATDDDFFFIQKAISRFVQLTEHPEEADVIHAVNWHALLPIDKTLLKKKIVISHIPHDVRNMLSQPEYLVVAPHVNHWIVPSLRAKQYVDLLSLPNIYIPYGLDHSVFYKIEDRSRIADLKRHNGIPEGKYLIGSFQRDTEGADLKTPKYVKGPDLFLEIVRNAYSQNRNLHIILAGPRRFWLRKRLAKADIPYTFIGLQIEGRDDLSENTLDRETMNKLYNLIDLYIVSSRMEGGPKAIVECAATGTKIISTDVGHAPDILHRNQIYDNFHTAAGLICDDMERDVLKSYVPENALRVARGRSSESISSSLSAFYKSILSRTGQTKSGNFREIVKGKGGFFHRLVRRKLQDNKISIYFQFKRPPWGGGNQFLLALSKWLKKNGWAVDNSLDSNARTLLFNSFHIDFKKMKKLRKSTKLIIHRIDGPTFLVRGKDRELDNNIFSVNNDVADVSVFQSAWSLFETLKMGYVPVNPVLISNAADLDIFNERREESLSVERKIKLLSASWSDNPKKGGPVYKWLDENLDWRRYEYTFVGRLSEPLKNIRVIEPVPSDELSEIMKQHDIYITASDNDPCSNSLIEALSCKLPVIYFRRGGHPELAGYGGLGFGKKEEIPELLNLLVENYEAFRSLVVAPDVDTVARKYMECMDLVGT
jgi:glycosyltransferase involved in cell wall biosynthesis